MPLEPGLPDDALLELGRLTWASLNLEDRAYGLCSILTGISNESPIGTRIAKVRKTLAGMAQTPATIAADTWLANASAALDGRHSILHATPVTWMPLPGTEPIPDVERDWLTYVPRSKSGKAVVHTALTAAALRPVRERVERALEGWVDVAELWWDEHPIAEG